MKRDEPRYRSLSSWLKEEFGEPVRKITIDAGLGCPNRDGTLGAGGCSYCNPRGSGTGAALAGVDIRDQIEQGAEYLARRYKSRKFIAYFQSFTNTYAPPERLRDLYEIAVDHPDVVGLAVGTRPDCVPADVLDVLESVSRRALVWVEYGLQSVHARTLELINRGHGPEAFFDAVKRTRARGLPVVAHLILGLPGESVSDMVETARAVGDVGVHGVKLHPLYVIRGTRLEEAVRHGGYVPLTEEAAQEAAFRVLEALPPDTVIHRLTSDPHPEELVAPLWMLDKRGVRARLNDAMERLDIRQGAKRRP